MLKLWRFDPDNPRMPTAAAVSHKLTAAVTAVAFIPNVQSLCGHTAVAVGLEDGGLEILTVHAVESEKTLHQVWKPRHVTPAACNQRNLHQHLRH